MGRHIFLFRVVPSLIISWHCHTGIITGIYLGNFGNVFHAITNFLHWNIFLHSGFFSYHRSANFRGVVVVVAVDGTVVFLGY